MKLTPRTNDHINFKIKRGKNKWVVFCYCSVWLVGTCIYIFKVLLFFMEVWKPSLLQLKQRHRRPQIRAQSRTAAERKRLLRAVQPQVSRPMQKHHFHPKARIILCFSVSRRWAAVSGAVPGREVITMATTRSSTSPSPRETKPVRSTAATEDSEEEGFTPTTSAVHLSRGEQTHLSLNSLTVKPLKHLHNLRDKVGMASIVLINQLLIQWEQTHRRMRTNHKSRIRDDPGSSLVSESPVSPQLQVQLDWARQKTNKQTKQY